MKKISILTATRAEYGLLKPIIKKLNYNALLNVSVVVTGAHLSPEFGLTYKEIEQDGIAIDEKIEILLSADTPSAISKSMGLAMIGFADYFTRYNPDMIIVLGDRYETLAVCCSAINFKIPIAHLYGGEITEGAIDDSIRHAITKLSYLHFTSTEEYRQRVVQLGEEPDRVVCVGAIGIENVMNQELMTKQELSREIEFDLGQNYFVITFHPVTLEENTSSHQFQQLLDALAKYKDKKFIFSKANADSDGRIINQMIDAFVRENDNAAGYHSLGMKKYLSLLKYSDLVLGNSSSGLVEAPSFGIPTINIGDRQKGRIQGDSILNCNPIKKEIQDTIDIALEETFKNKSKITVNPYGDGNTSDKIVNIISDFLLNDKISLKKKFYDCEEI